ncbi:MAG: epoxyqueuosine reductase QueH [bacterium]
MKVLMHVCCGPCAVYPTDTLRAESMELMLYFFNPNVQPYQEFERRLNAARRFAEQAGLKMIEDTLYDPEEWFRMMAFRESFRCRICYRTRLEAAAQVARRGGFDAFTTTILYSKQQHHDLARELGEAVGEDKGVPFLYRDFRHGWKEGIEKSKELELYRQQYCGCIYSERDRFQGRREKTRERGS